MPRIAPKSPEAKEKVRIYMKEYMKRRRMKLAAQKRGDKGFVATAQRSVVKPEHEVGGLPGAQHLTKAAEAKLSKIVAATGDKPENVLGAALALAQQVDKVPGEWCGTESKSTLARQYDVAEGTLRAISTRRMGILDEIPEIRRKMAAHKLAMAAIVDGKVHERMDELDELAVKDVVAIGKNLTDSAISLLRENDNKVAASHSLNIGDVQALTVFLSGNGLGGSIAERAKVIEAETI